MLKRDPVKKLVQPMSTPLKLWHTYTMVVVWHAIKEPI